MQKKPTTENSRECEAESCYILVATDSNKFLLSAPSGFEIASKCLDKGMWGFTARRRLPQLNPDDKVIIYIAGVREQHQSFVASAVVADVLREEALRVGDTCFPNTVKLRSIRRFRTPVSIKPLLDHLSFVSHNRKKWGCCLVGGVLRISSEDYIRILRAADTQLR